MNEDNRPPSVCLSGEAACSVIEELNKLRKENRRLEKLVHTDTLTALYNLRFFLQSLDREMDRARRTGIPVALIFLDLDNFKRVNDNWGHEAGNRALVHVSRLIRETIRKTDIPCRYGGEEFAVILPATRLQVARTVAERLRKLVESDALVLDKAGRMLPLSISLGLDVMGPGYNDNPEKFINSVDAYLYQAKHRGRNCLCHPAVAKLSAYLVDEPVQQSE